MPAYYNEIDAYTAKWLENLIAAGQIVRGTVDSRSIHEVRDEDLTDRVQAHFFAGIGVWSYALRKAGWPDVLPVWTGSCPCQPFSVAGRKKGFDDERHLWPIWFALIRQCNPPVVLGEQVASPDGLAWLDLVQSDMEGQGYAFAAIDTCAAGFGAPHIRQRLYWAAITRDERCEEIRLRLRERQEGSDLSEAGRDGEVGRILADSKGRRQTKGGTTESGTTARTRSADHGFLGNSGGARGGRNSRAVPRAQAEGPRKGRGAWSVSDHCAPSSPSSRWIGGSKKRRAGRRGETV